VRCCLLLGSEIRQDIDDHLDTLKQKKDKQETIYGEVRVLTFRDADWSSVEHDFNPLLMLCACCVACLQIDLTEKQIKSYQKEMKERDETIDDRVHCLN
jgi:hypothetical protein